MSVDGLAWPRRLPAARHGESAGNLARDRAEACGALRIEIAARDMDVPLSARGREQAAAVGAELVRGGLDSAATVLAYAVPAGAADRRGRARWERSSAGGESWCDVALRVRSALDSIRREHPGGDVVVVAHQVVLLVLRYVVEGLSEAEILAIDGEGDLVNGGLSTFVLDAAAGRLVVAAWNVGTHLPVEGVEPTREPPQPAEQSTGAGEPGRAALPERTR